MFLLVAFAGCAGESGSESTGSGAKGFKVANDKTTGSIVGFVLDDSLLPIEGAKVFLLTADGGAVYSNATTDETGKYGFSFIPAGDYQLEARANGYDKATIKATVKAAQTLDDVSFYLPAAFADVAYFVTDTITRMIGGGTVKYGFHCAQTPWASLMTGPLSAGASLVGKHCVGANGCFEELGCTNASGGCQGSYSKETGVEDNGYGQSSYAGGYRDLLRNNTDWQSMVTEVAWKPSSTISGRGVLFEILGPNVTNANGGHTSRCGGLNQSDPRDFLVVSDQAPVRIEINDDLLQARGISDDDRCCDWRFRLFPGWCDLGHCSRWGPDANALGVIAPTTVTVYYSIFFKERSPPGWSTLPEDF